MFAFGDVFVNLNRFVSGCIFIESSVEAFVYLSYVEFGATWAGELIDNGNLKFLEGFVLA